MTFMLSYHANYVFSKFSLTKFLIQYTTLLMNTMIFTSVMNDWFFYISYEIYFLNFAFIYVIVQIVKYIKLVNINYTIYYNRYCRHQFFFHILTINFILVLFKTKNDLNIKMFVICKHNKRIIYILKKII